jgi:hypothetical protein
MKKLDEIKLLNLQGGISNRSCMILGGLTLVSAVFGFWPGAIGITAGATVASCFG